MPRQPARIETENAVYFVISNNRPFVVLTWATAPQDETSVQQTAVWWKVSADCLFLPI